MWWMEMTLSVALAGWTREAAVDASHLFSSQITAANSLNPYNNLTM